MIQSNYISMFLNLPMLASLILNIIKIHFIWKRRMREDLAINKCSLRSGSEEHVVADPLLQEGFPLAWLQSRNAL